MASLCLNVLRPTLPVWLKRFLAEDVAIIPRWTTGVDREGAASLRYALIIASSIGPMRAMSKPMRTAKAMDDIYDDPQYWRDRAYEARTHAMYIRDAETRSTMLGIADQFERLGRLGEQRVNGSDLR
jgi:hypothetical protein